MFKRIDRPLVFLDIESTGLSVSSDRIVEIAMIRMEPDGMEKTFSSLVNPGLVIPEPAFQLHRISNEMTRNAPTFKELAPQVRDFIGPSDLGGYGVFKFDIPMLRAEFDRAQVAFDLEGRRVVDPLVIFRRMERRNLSAAYKFYCGKNFEGAHRAQGDAKAAWDVFWEQTKRYPDLPEDMTRLDAFCRDFQKQS